MYNNVFVKSWRDDREIKSIDNSFGNYLVDGGLYTKFDITEENINELADLVGGHVKIDIFCPKCKEKRVFECEKVFKLLIPGDSRREFSIEDEIILHQESICEPKPHFVDRPNDPWTWYDDLFFEHVRVMTFKFHCTMDVSHSIDYVVLVENNQMMKIGQYPTIADLTYPELNKYKKVMPSKQDEAELRRARGLYANGIGIGAYVYLRRIFERILNAAIDEAITENKIRKEDLQGKRVDEKIKLVAYNLPQIIVNNTSSYGIISKGIHELSEEECKEYFPVLEAFIMMTLEQWERIRHEKEEERALVASINKIASKI